MDTKIDDDGEEKDDSKRKSRNLSEKKRRDQFNTLVNDLNILISVNNKKMDKSSILKSTISFLKHHKEIAKKSKSLDIKEDWKPPFLSNEEFIHLILEALDGFIIIFSTKGDILYISESVTSLLGYLPQDVLLMTIYDIAYEMDHDFIFNICNVKAINENRNKETSFYCHLKRRSISNSERLSYELVRFVGYFRYDVELDHILRKGNESKNVAFIGIGRIQKPQLIKQMSIVNSSQNEFLSKHSLEWKFLYLDHRAPPIIGYLPFEVLGTSGYDYYHYDDLEKVVSSHEELIQKGEGQSVFYRFLTKGQQWIWLKTHSHIQYHQSVNPKPELVVCIHQVVCYADVIKTKNNFKRESDCCDYNKLKSFHKLNSKMKSAKHKKCKHFLRYPETSTPLSAESMKIHTPQNAQSIVHIMPSSEITSQIIATTSCQFAQSPSHYSIRTPQIVGHTFLEPQQYLAAIPVQPVLPTIPFATASSIIPTFSSSSEVLQGVVMTPAAIQLQRKHDELQKRIMSQQQELRRVSEQLIVAKNLHRFNIPVTYNSSKHSNNDAKVYNLSSLNHLNEKYLELDENRYQRQMGNPNDENRITNIEQFTYINEKTNYGSDHEDRTSNINSNVTSNDLEILPYQLSHEQSQLLFDTSNSSNDVNLTLKNCK